MKPQILMLPGDGIGPEIMDAAVKVMNTIEQKFGFGLTYIEGLIGAAAIDATGSALPDDTLLKAKSSAAVLLAAVGDPRFDNDPSAKVRPEQGLLKIRSELGLFANLRPITIYPQLADASPLKKERIEGVDILFFRELTGGIYFGKPRERLDNGNEAIDTMRYTKPEVHRIVKMAFEAALTRKKKLCSVDKANVLETSRLWRETVNQLAVSYPDVTLEHMFVDAAAMELLRQPNRFDVIVTENMFGDILTDEASVIPGSLGLLPSASVGSAIALYEPIHGSAPTLAKTNKANPMAMILSVALMYRNTFNRNDIASAIEQAVYTFIDHGWRTADLADSNTPANKILGTTQTADAIVNHLSQ